MRTDADSGERVSLPKARTREGAGISSSTCFSSIETDLMNAASYALAGGQQRKGLRRSQKLAPLDEDAVKAGTCSRCGLVGDHRTAMQCIVELRDRLAERG
jgi:hypothetical protein